MHKDIKNHFGCRMGRLSRRFQTLFLSMLKINNLSFAQGVILGFLHQRGEMFAQELAKELDKDKATISREVNNMCKNNLIIKQVDSNDKRIVILKLTQNGKELFESIKDKLELVEKLITNNIPQNELQTCINVLDKIYTLLNDNMEA